ncbi:unnamed protein product [Orchesella dallaii]|uniref:Phosphatidylinositol transfer protein N-terminal domain-containing protein n=1 Tax=Orchesella dallaii TaxID=48710 RepID=A0ABP1S0C2_9HEXA
MEEFRIAQQHMIAKKSKEEETKGTMSVLVNESYNSGPGGRGQYTKKVYRVGSHLHTWLSSFLPKAAQTIEEEQWNAYPYTKIMYTCPFLRRFSIEIETRYCADKGEQENVFGLTGSDLRNRVIDIINIVKDDLSGADYLKEEDPKLFVSKTTSRGPLSENWIEEYRTETKGKSELMTSTTPNGNGIMCSYKICRVKFHYWGMQNKVENFIHDIALRKTMLRAHRQIWAWQDEWNVVVAGENP